MAYSLSVCVRACFNPRPRMGGDRNGFREIRDYPVSIHAPAWGATKIPENVFSDKHVSIHAPAWGATAERSFFSAELMFQSTPPHGGRLSRLFQMRKQQRVSIHAPAWGATPKIYHTGISFYVSIHAPAWGAT